MADKKINCKVTIALMLVSLVFVLAVPVTLAIPDKTKWQALVTQGDVDIKQQRLAPAEFRYRQALKSIKHNPHSTDDLIMCMEKLASTLALESKINEAIPVYRKALHKLERTYGMESPKLVTTLYALSSIFESEGEPRYALKLYQRALTINEKNFGPASPEVAESLHRLGHANANMGEFELAEQQYRSSLSIFMQQPGLYRSSQLEDLLGDYNDLLRKNDVWNRKFASDFQTEVLKDHIEEQGPRIAIPSSFQTEVLKDHIGAQGPTTAVPSSAWQKQITDQLHKVNQFQDNEDQQVLSRGFKQPLSNSTLAPAYDVMSNALHGQHRYKQGEEQYQRMIALDIKTLGLDHPSVADDLTGLALLCISQHRYADAKLLLKHALSIYETNYGSDNLLVVRTREYLASVCNNLGDKQQAVALHNEAFGKAPVTLQPNNLETARMLNELGFLYYSQGKLEDACTIYQWALASTRGAVGSQDELVAACLTDYANVLRSLGRTTEANQMDERADIIKAKHPNS